MTARCKHCSHDRVNRPRGLCWSCYYTPGVKELYPSTSKYARRGTGNGMQPSVMPAAPTTTVPGTPEKLGVLEQRAKAGEQLFHPADARYPGDQRPYDFLKGLPYDREEYTPSADHRGPYRLARAQRRGRGVEESAGSWGDLTLSEIGYGYGEREAFRGGF